MGGAASWKTNAEELVEDKDLTGKVYFVTGANAGLGLETCRVLAKAGGTVVIAARNQAKCDGAKAEVVKNSGCKEENIKTCVLDLSSLQSVENAVVQFKALNLGRLDCLINNAGVMSIPKWQTTADGFEKQWGVNHVGHQHLTTLLLDDLKASAPSRVVTLTSSAHLSAPNPFQASLLPPKQENYDPMVNYCTSKMSNVNMSLYLHDQYKEAGITAYAVHPGVVDTNLGHNDEGRICMMRCFYCCASLCSCCICSDAYRFKSVPQGAATTVLCTVSDLDKLTSGGYYADVRESQNKRREATDTKLAMEVWNVTKDCIEEAKKNFK